MKKLRFLFIGFSLLFASCSLFENDVADFMEKYTETAAIETCEISVETYQDALSQRCIASEEDTDITMYMRNPKQFALIPSVTFAGLSGDLSRESVDISQTDTFTIALSLPQDFLIPADEGQDITADISLYEPMSGREFDHFIIDLHCNTKPPALLNPTIINNSNSTFVVAFDMPSPEEVAVRHKDISAVEINGHSYPVIVTTRDDPEVEGAKIAEYEIADSHFTRTAGSGYTFLGGKEFTANTKTSFYYDTGDTFFSGDQEYNLILKDRAGLESTVKASTSISKLQKPVLKDQNGTVISENAITGIPFNEDTMTGSVTIIPPTEDHLGNPVSGTTVYYKVYEATGSGRIYTSGTTTSTKTIDLPQNTYRVEAYATLTNYENSSTTTVKFRFINNILFVKAGATNGDGSEGAPYATIAEALADIKDRPRHESMFTIYAEDDGTTILDEDIDLHDNINTDQLTIAKKPGASSATIKSVYIASSLPSGFSLIINGMTIDGAAYNGIQKDSGIPLTISNVTINNSGSNGIEINAGSITATNLNISSSGSIGIKMNGGSLTYTGGTISNNTQDGIHISSAGSHVYNNGTISGNDNGIYIADGTLTYNNGTINGNANAGIRINDATVTYNNGSITSNTGSGISCSNGTLTVAGGTITGNNTGIVSNGTTNINGGNITENSEKGLSLYGGTLNLTGGTISSNDEDGIYIDGGTNHTIFGGFITNNEGAGIAAECPALTIKGGTITGNHNTGVMLYGTPLKLSGNPIIKNNTTSSGPSEVIKNVTMGNPATSYTIEIIGPLTTGCDVGITTATGDEPNAIGQKFSFTTNYGTYNTASPSNYFKSDRGFAIVANGSGSSMQAAIGLAGASGTTAYSADDFKFTFAIADEAGNTGTDFYAGFFPGVAKNFVIIPTVKRKESNGNLTSLSYSATDKKLREGSNIQASDATVSWTVSLYNGGTLVKSYTASELTHLTVGSDGALKIPVDQPFEGDYTLKATATYLGIEHSAEFDLLCSQNAADAVSYINTLTGGTHSIALSGPITADNIAAINTAIKNKYQSNSVYINLDLSDVTGLTSLADNAFKENSGLHSIVLPEGITSLGEDCFNQCYHLQSINLPDSITNIGKYCFYCDSNVKIDKIPAGLTSIAEYAFYSCGIEEAIIPDSVTSIGASAFSSCTHLSRVVLPSGITELPDGSFFNNKVDSIDLPEGLTTIGSSALGATRITTLHLPSSLTEFDQHAFMGSDYIESVTVETGNTTFKSIDGVLYKYNDDDSLSLYLYPSANSTSFVIPSGQNITSIEGSAFYKFPSHPLTSLTIPVSVTTLKTVAFNCCTSLESLNYTGTITQWNAITKETSWNAGLNITTVHCSDGDVTIP